MLLCRVLFEQWMYWFESDIYLSHVTTDFILFVVQVWPAVIKQHIALELPFMATEVILMQCVKAGGDRQVRYSIP